MDNNLEIDEDSLSGHGDRLIFTDEKQTTLSMTFKDRWMRSKLRDYWRGTDLSQQSADDAVNTFTLINALVLTIPVALLGYMNYEFWDWVKATNDTYCPEDEIYDILYDTFTFRQSLIFTTCGSSLGMGLLYFTLRPEGGKNDEEKKKRAEKDLVFHAWWKLGKYIMLLLVISTVLTSIMTYMMLAYMLSTVVNSTDSLCDNYAAIRYGWGGGGYFSLVIIATLALFY